MSRFADPRLVARGALLASLALASCGVPDDPITFATSFRVESFQIFPSPPVAGGRVHFEVVSASVFELEVSQQGTVLLSAVKPLDTTRASFIAATSDAPSLWARGRDFAETTVTATPWSETCHADGVWSTSIAQTSGAGCTVADEDVATATFEVQVGGALGTIAGRSGAGARAGGGCRFDFALGVDESARLSPNEGTLDVTLRGTTADGAPCTATWTGAATRD
ncbi:hypothetical protein L6R52_05705 [Myxococcota bacterium]|nr:hypothetical protein [Myxococcota bacterium]